jgi:hypothetical protein
LPQAADAPSKPIEVPARKFLRVLRPIRKFIMLYAIRSFYLCESAFIRGQLRPFAPTEDQLIEPWGYFSYSFDDITGLMRPRSRPLHIDSTQLSALQNQGAHLYLGQVVGEPLSWSKRLSGAWRLNQQMHGDEQPFRATQHFVTSPSESVCGSNLRRSPLFTSWWDRLIRGHKAAIAETARRPLPSGGILTKLYG